MRGRAGHLFWAALAVWWLLIAGGVSGCGGDRPSDPTPTESESPAASPVALAEVREGILSLLTHPQVKVYWEAPWPGMNPGSFTCEGPEHAAAGTAVTCRWVDDCAECAQAVDATTLVVMIDDAGRYAAVTSQPRPLGVEDFPPDASCTALAEPVTFEGILQPLDYVALLHSWLAAGRPARLDDDSDGRPCDEVFPAAVVDAVFASPLAVRPAVRDDPPTLDDVRRQAEAFLGAVARREILTGCGGPELAVAGSAMRCLFSEPVNEDGLYLSVLDDTGRYVVGQYFGEASGHPTLADYPADSGCQEYSEPPSNGVPSYGLPYDVVYYRWLELGMPDDWDEDGDQRPCEDSFNQGAIDGMFARAFLP